VSPLRLARPEDAEENGWQGKPPQMTSTGRRLPLPAVRMSPCRWTWGQCLARRARAQGSISTCQAIWKPARSKPRSKPPMPEKREPTESTGRVYTRWNWCQGWRTGRWDPRLPGTRGDGTRGLRDNSTRGLGPRPETARDWRTVAALEQPGSSLDNRWPHDHVLGYGRRASTEQGQWVRWGRHWALPVQPRLRPVSAMHPLLSQSGTISERRPAVIAQEVRCRC
jgi:hypothetical protein